MKSQLIRKDPDAGKDQRQKEKGTTEDEMVGWYHQLNGHDIKDSELHIQHNHRYIKKMWTEKIGKKNIKICAGVTSEQYSTFKNILK